MMNLTEYRRTATHLADFLPWAALVGSGVVLNKDGSFQRTAKFRGPDLDSAVAAELVAVAGRINNADIYWNWRTNRDRGFSRDLRQDIYETLLHATPEDLIRFHQKHIKGRRFHWLVLGDENQIDLKYLKTLGKVEKLTLEDVFGRVSGAVASLAP